MSAVMPDSGLKGEGSGTPWGTALLIAVTGALTFVALVELVNIMFYDPYGEEVFLFRTAGILADTDIATLTGIMFGSLFVLLMMGLPLAFVTGGLGVVFIYLVGDAFMLNIIPTRIFPMMMTPAGTIVPSRILVIGAGVAGMRAAQEDGPDPQETAEDEQHDLRQDVIEQAVHVGSPRDWRIQGLTGASST